MVAPESLPLPKVTPLSDLAHLLRRYRLMVVSVVDLTAWLVTFVIFAWLRYDVAASVVPWAAVCLLGLGTGLAFMLVAWASGLYRGRSATGSLDEMILLGVSVMGVGAVSTVLNLAAQWVPRSVPPAAAVGTLVIAAWARAVWRRGHEKAAEGQRHHDGVRVLLIGAGEAGKELLGSMLRDPERQWRPVGILDDDPRKRRLRIRAVPVLGTTAELANIAAREGAETVIVAIPSADAETIERLRRAATDAGLSVKVLPSANEILQGGVGIRDIRDINLTDVLGRHQLDTDVGAIASYLAGRRVLVTGAGGSIGSELCRQIHQFGPAELMMLDRDESALHAVQLSIHGRALLDGGEVILCDIRDERAVQTIFDQRRPEVVFHAAALKHLPMLEQYPAEAVKTNIIGTRIVLDAACRSGVTTFVNISTDKAANPCSVLGYSKRIAEAITAGRAVRTQRDFVSVRFGNVLGSRGSVLTSFARQIAEGGPVTVTDPDVTRYFMTIEEACQLVVQAAAIGRPGEALVLDMGAPIRILDVAHQLMEQAGSRVPVEFTGLRIGEKMHEDLFADFEPVDVRPQHPLISHVPVPMVSDLEVEALPSLGDDQVVRRAMALMCARLAGASESALASESVSAPRVPCAAEPSVG